MRLTTDVMTLLPLVVYVSGLFRICWLICKHLWNIVLIRCWTSIEVCCACKQSHCLGPLTEISAILITRSYLPNSTTAELHCQPVMLPFINTYFSVCIHPVFFCLNRLRPSPVSHLTLWSLSLGTDSAVGVVVEIYPQHSRTSYVVSSLLH